MLDARVFDEDAEAVNVTGDLFEDEENGEASLAEENTLRTEADYKNRAAAVYGEYSTQFKKRFKWLPSELFIKSLAKDLLEDARALLAILDKCGEWSADRDAKLAALVNLLTKTHAQDKILVFTQFADTARYLGAQLKSLKLKAVATVTGDSPDPTELARRFSPVNNNRHDQIAPEDELRALIATDVLSEGHQTAGGRRMVRFADAQSVDVRLLHPEERLSGWRSRLFAQPDADLAGAQRQGQIPLLLPPFPAPALSRRSGSAIPQRRTRRAARQGPLPQRRPLRRSPVGER
jgi:hypothetical protein